MTVKNLLSPRQDTGARRQRLMLHRHSCGDQALLSAGRHPGQSYGSFCLLMEFFNDTHCARRVGVFGFLSWPAYLRVARIEVFFVICCADMNDFHERSFVLGTSLLIMIAYSDDLLISPRIISPYTSRFTFEALHISSHTSHLTSNILLSY